MKWSWNGPGSRETIRCTMQAFPLYWDVDSAYLRRFASCLVSLQPSALDGNVEAIRRWIASGSPADIRNEHGATPLMLAAGSGHLAVLAELLRCGADLGAVDNDLWTVLHWAAPRRRIEAARLCMAAGADIGLRDVDGKTAWELAPDAFSSLVPTLAVATC